MCNHFHLLLEIPPMPVGGLSDTDLLERLGAIYNEAAAANVLWSMRDLRKGVG